MLCACISKLQTLLHHSSCYQRAMRSFNGSSRYCHDVQQLRPSVRLSVCLSVVPFFLCLGQTCITHCDHTVHFSKNLSLWLDSPMYGHSNTKARLPTPSRLFPVLLNLINE